MTMSRRVVRKGKFAALIEVRSGDLLGHIVETKDPALVRAFDSLADGISYCEAVELNARRSAAALGSAPPHPADRLIGRLVQSRSGRLPH